MGRPRKKKETFEPTPTRRSRRRGGNESEDDGSTPVIFDAKVSKTELKRLAIDGFHNQLTTSRGSQNTSRNTSRESSVASDAIKAEAIKASSPLPPHVNVNANTSNESQMYQLKEVSQGKPSGEDSLGLATTPLPGKTLQAAVSKLASNSVQEKLVNEADMQTESHGEQAPRELVEVAPKTISNKGRKGSSRRKSVPQRRQNKEPQHVSGHEACEEDYIQNHEISEQTEEESAIRVDKTSNGEQVIAAVEAPVVTPSETEMQFDCGVRDKSLPHGEDESVKGTIKENNLEEKDEKTSESKTFKSVEENPYTQGKPKNLMMSEEVLSEKMSKGDISLESEQNVDLVVGDEVAKDVESEEDEEDEQEIIDLEDVELRGEEPTDDVNLDAGEWRVPPELLNTTTFEYDGEVSKEQTSLPEGGIHAIASPNAADKGEHSSCLNNIEGYQNETSATNMLASHSESVGENSEATLSFENDLAQKFKERDQSKEESLRKNKAYDEHQPKIQLTMVSKSDNDDSSTTLESESPQNTITESKEREIVTESCESLAQVQQSDFVDSEILTNSATSNNNEETEVSESAIDLSQSNNKEKEKVIESCNDSVPADPEQMDCDASTSAKTDNVSAEDNLTYNINGRPKTMLNPPNADSPLDDACQFQSEAEDKGKEVSLFNQEPVTNHTENMETNVFAKETTSEISPVFKNFSTDELDKEQFNSSQISSESQSEPKDIKQGENSKVLKEEDAFTLAEPMETDSAYPEEMKTSLNVTSCGQNLAAQEECTTDGKSAANEAVSSATSDPNLGSPAEENTDTAVASTISLTKTDIGNKVKAGGQITMEKCRSDTTAETAEDGSNLQLPDPIDKEQEESSNVLDKDDESTLADSMEIDTPSKEIVKASYDSASCDPSSLALENDKTEVIAANVAVSNPTISEPDLRKTLTAEHTKTGRIAAISLVNTNTANEAKRDGEGTLEICHNVTKGEAAAQIPDSHLTVSHERSHDSSTDAENERLCSLNNDKQASNIDESAETSVASMTIDAQDQTTSSHTSIKPSSLDCNSKIQLNSQMCQKKRPSRWDMTPEKRKQFQSLSQISNSQEDKGLSKISRKDGPTVLYISSGPVNTSAIKSSVKLKDGSITSEKQDLTELYKNKQDESHFDSQPPVSKYAESISIDAISSSSIKNNKETDESAKQSDGASIELEENEPIDLSMDSYNEPSDAKQLNDTKDECSEPVVLSMDSSISAQKMKSDVNPAENEQPPVCIEILSQGCKESKKDNAHEVSVSKDTESDPKVSTCSSASVVELEQSESHNLNKEIIEKNQEKDVSSEIKSHGDLKVAKDNSAIEGKSKDTKYEAVEPADFATPPRESETQNHSDEIMKKADEVDGIIKTHEETESEVVHCNTNETNTSLPSTSAQKVDEAVSGDETQMNSMAEESADVGVNGDETRMDSTLSQNVVEAVSGDETRMNSTAGKNADKAVSDDEIRVDSASAQNADKAVRDDEIQVDSASAQNADKANSDDEIQVDSTSAQNVDEAVSGDEIQVDSASAQNADKAVSGDEIQVDSASAQNADEAVSGDEIQVDSASAQNADKAVSGDEIQVDSASAQNADKAVSGDEIQVDSASAQNADKAVSGDETRMDSTLSQNVVEAVSGDETLMNSTAGKNADKAVSDDEMQVDSASAQNADEAVSGDEIQVDSASAQNADEAVRGDEIQVDSASAQNADEAVRGDDIQVDSDLLASKNSANSRSEKNESGQTTIPDWQKGDVQDNFRDKVGVNDCRKEDCIINKLGGKLEDCMEEPEEAKKEIEIKKDEGMQGRTEALNEEEDKNEVQFEKSHYEQQIEGEKDEDYIIEKGTTEMPNEEFEQEDCNVLHKSERTIESLESKDNSQLPKSSEQNDKQNSDDLVSSEEIDSNLQDEKEEEENFVCAASASELSPQDFCQKSDETNIVKLPKNVLNEGFNELTEKTGDEKINEPHDENLDFVAVGSLIQRCDPTKNDLTSKCPSDERPISESGRSGVIENDVIAMDCDITSNKEAEREKVAKDTTNTKTYNHHLKRDKQEDAEITRQEGEVGIEVKYEEDVEMPVLNVTATDTRERKQIIPHAEGKEDTLCAEIGTDCNIGSEKTRDEEEMQEKIQDVKKENEDISGKEEPEREEDLLESSGGSSSVRELSMKQEIKNPLKEVSLYEGEDQKWRGGLSRWQLVCDTLEDWTDLALQLEAETQSTSGMRGRFGKSKALCNIIKHDFLPEMPMIMADKVSCLKLT